MVDKILSCTLSGKMGHFRKFYTNSSSLTYALPPRTVISGILAGAIGRERDSYYDEFSGKKCSIGVSLGKPFRKLIQTVNYLLVKGKDDLTGRGGHTQIPLEFVIPRHGFSRGMLEYEIFFASRNKDLYEEIKTRLQNHSPVFSPYLGLSECPGTLRFNREYSTGDGTLSREQSVEPVSFSCVIRKDMLIPDGLLFMHEQDTYRYIMDKMPVEFDRNRNNLDNGDFIFEADCKKVVARISCPHYRLKDGSKEKNILFMENSRET